MANRMKECQRKKNIPLCQTKKINSSTNREEKGETGEIFVIFFLLLRATIERILTSLQESQENKSFED